MNKKDDNYNFDSLMLTIDQASRLTGVPKATLRVWEKSYVGFLKPARTKSNRREYSKEDLDRITDLPPVVVPSFKLGWGSSQAIDPGGA